MNAAAEKIIADLSLAPLPHEGGFFRQTWTSPQTLPGGRAAGSAILFLVAPGEFSALHRLATDEVWHFHAGDAVEHLQLDPSDGSARTVLLGADLSAGHQPQVIVPGGIWQGARLASVDVGRSQPAGWALLGCVMAPAWDENEFVLGRREDLKRTFPAHADLIAGFCR
jgi:predicted cupin superfamily sugar epimerase